jgi:hypothetical protein
MCVVEHPFKRRSERDLLLAQAAPHAARSASVLIRLPGAQRGAA